MKPLLPPDDDPTRERVRNWLKEHPRPTGRELAQAGYVAPHWPKPWGLDASPLAQLVIEEELRTAGVKMPDNPIGIGWAGPTILHAGTEEQKDRYLFPLLSGEEIWCQLFSEPEAGSDLATLGTRAVRDGDHYIVNGRKIWTSYAHLASFGILLARTDINVPKRKGITYLICPMDSPGITVRPIKDMASLTNFNEVFLDDVVIPIENRVGAENEGWSLAKVTLANERVSLSKEGALWGAGPTVADLIRTAKAKGGLTDTSLRQRLIQLYIEGEIIEVIRHRMLSAAIKGIPPGPEASIRKALADKHGQEVMGLARDMAGTAGMLLDVGPMGKLQPKEHREGGSPGYSNKMFPPHEEVEDWPEEFWAFGYLFAPALTIGGGTAEVQKNIIAERLLGLPRDLDPHSNRTWAETLQDRPLGKGN